MTHYLKIKKALQVNGKLFIGLTTKPTLSGINNTTNLKNLFGAKKPFFTKGFSQFKRSGRDSNPRPHA
jgi:hypothetical protein